MTTTHQPKKGKAVVLFSGGLDSTATLLIALKRHEEVYALTIHYGQRNDMEIKHAHLIVQALGNTLTDHIDFSIPSILGSTLTGAEKANANCILPTYVPARNIIFLAYAASYAETIFAQNIYNGATRGTNERTESAYPDSTPEFFNEMGHALRAGTMLGRSIGMRIITPVLHKPKHEIISMIPTRLLKLTRSCYNLDENGISCGLCDACILRLTEFGKADMEDPIPYHEVKERKE